ncbi:MAG TPA: terminase gpA endonuclease subunit [Phycisphaerae bacterium]|nr:terminase gpA endonuclease subunit [Phycisphaerae bacterium]
MAIDPRRLRPTQLVQLLNSTPLGTVTSERQLYRHRERAGLRIVAAGDSSKLDLLRYLAWLVLERHRPRPEFDGLTGYEAQKERARERNLLLSRSGRDIGELPAVVNVERKEKASRDFRYFCEQYFPKTFCLPWSDDHHKVIGLIQVVVLEGGQFAIALPRGGGKTVLVETAALWAMLYGHRPFVAIIGPDEGHAVERVKNLRTELEHNDLLLEDFPEVCLPIRRLEGINQRRLLYQGEYIHMEFTAKRIVLPSIPGSKAAGAIIETTGLTGQIRGLNYKMRDGRTLRPSLCIVDDPQTRESAHSPTQCHHREKIINGDIMGLAGPGASIAVLLPCTVIQPDDLADRLLDPEKNPQWNGQRTKMVYAWPKNEELWAKYVALRRDTQRSCGGQLGKIAEACNAYYAKHREAMDKGAVIAWAHRHKAEELSALQHAWNLRIDLKEEAFFAEYQNEPLPEGQVDVDLLTADQIAAKGNGLKRGIIPKEATSLTMFVDVQGKALFYMVVAWGQDFTGYVVDYGTEPDQKRSYFALREVQRTLAQAMPGAGQEAAIVAGLERLTEATIGREWLREDGTIARIDRCLIDAGWGPMTHTVYQFCRQSKYAHVVVPSYGRYVGAASLPFTDYQKQPGDRIGLNWRIPATSKRICRYVIFDTNFWKSFIQSRLAVAKGDPGSLTLFGRKPELHRLLAEHLTSEYRVPTEGRGRTVEEWKLRVDGSDNHWLDGVVGCAVAASIQGVELAEMKLYKRKFRRVSYAEMRHRILNGDSARPPTNESQMS